MSHFALLVVTNTNSEDELNAALAPFHEFECTGLDDQYVVDVDITDEYLKMFNEETKPFYVSPTGERYPVFDNRFFRELTPEETASLGSDIFARIEGLFVHSADWGDGKGYRRKAHMKIAELPGWTEVTVNTNTVTTFVEWVKDYAGYDIVTSIEDAKNDSEYQYGYVLVTNGTDVRVIKRTNPNSQWDWWVVGGRYSDRLVLKNGLRVNQSKKSDIDFEGMRQKNCGERLAGVAKTYDDIRKKSIEVILGFGNTDNITLTNAQITAKWNEFRELYVPLKAEWQALGDEAQPRHFWDWAKEKSPEFEILNKIGISEIGFGFGWTVPISEPDPIAWAGKAPPMTAYAFLAPDGQWVESGKMGWWGITTDKMDENLWETMLAEKVSQISDGQYITYVDCHI